MSQQPRRRVMTPEEREEDRRLAMATERLEGDIVDSRQYDARCPKCGYLREEGRTFAKGFCRGDIIETKDDLGACRRKGEHLHGKCGVCGFTWAERCHDSSDLAL